jgi:hypothetical protein
MAAALPTIRIDIQQRSVRAVRACAAAFTWLGAPATLVQSQTNWAGPTTAQ